VKWALGGLLALAACNPVPYQCDVLDTDGEVVHTTEGKRSCAAFAEERGIVGVQKECEADHPEAAECVCTEGFHTCEILDPYGDNAVPQ